MKKFQIYKDLVSPYPKIVYLAFFFVEQNFNDNWHLLRNKFRDLMLPAYQIFISNFFWHFFILRYWKLSTELTGKEFEMFHRIH